MRNKFKISLAAAAVCLVGFAGSANAVTVVGPAATAGSCSSVTFTGISPTECAGGYDDNLLKGSVGDATGLAALLALGSPGGTYVEKIEDIDGNTINFAQLLTGITVIGIHYGNGSGLGNATSFFKFDAGSQGVDSFTFNLKGLSNAAIFSTGGAVPEPATWGMMILGLGLIGGVMRRRQRTAVSYAF